MQVAFSLYCATVAYCRGCVAQSSDVPSVPWWCEVKAWPTGGGKRTPLVRLTLGALTYPIPARLRNRETGCQYLARACQNRLRCLAIARCFTMAIGFAGCFHPMRLWGQSLGVFALSYTLPLPTHNNAFTQGISCGRSTISHACFGKVGMVGGLSRCLVRFLNPTNRAVLDAGKLD